MPLTTRPSALGMSDPGANPTNFGKPKGHLREVLNITCGI